MEILLSEEYQVRSFSNTQEFVRALDEQSFCAVLTDLVLDGAYDGIWLLRDIRENPSLAHLKIVAVSGYAPDFTPIAATPHRFDGHLTKPVDGDDILDLLASLIRPLQDYEAA